MQKNTLEALENLWGKEPYEVELLESIVKILDSLPEFYEFLKNQKYSSYELAFPTFGFIVDFLDILSSNGDTKTLCKTLDYLEGMRLSTNKYERNLLFVGVLENFDRLASLPNIIPLMPEGLRKDFIETFPQYVGK